MANIIFSFSNRSGIRSKIHLIGPGLVERQSGDSDILGPGEDLKEFYTAEHGFDSPEGGWVVHNIEGGGFFITKKDFTVEEGLNDKEVLITTRGAKGDTIEVAVP